MKSGFLGTVAMFFLGAGWAIAQGPAPSPMTDRAPMAPGVVMPSTVAMQPATTGEAPYIAADAYVGNGGGPIFYTGAEYLLWKVQNTTVPAAASFTPFGVIPVTGSNTQLPLGGGAPVVLPANTALLPVSTQSGATFAGGGSTNTGYQNGGRFTVGFWADRDMTVGLEASFLFLANGTDQFAAISGQGPGTFTAPTGVNQTIFVPTVTFAGGVPTISFTQNITPIILAGQSTSTVTGHVTNSLYTGDLNVRSIFLRFGGMDFGVLGGYRFLTFRDEVSLNNNVQLAGLTINGTPPTTLPNLTFSSVDNTRVQNYFNGAQVGMDVDAKFGSYFIYARGLVAVGNNHQVADVNSTSTTLTNGVTTTSAGGLLAGPADNGRHTRDVLSVIPQVDVKFGYQFTPWLRGSIGYGGLFLNNFGRGTETASTSTLNSTTNINGSATSVNVLQPTFRFHDRDIYVQGITFGLEARF